MMNRRIINMAAGAAFALFAAQGALAAEVLVRAGAHYFNTDGDDFGLEVDDSATVTAMAVFLINDNWGIEILGGLPFKYDIDLQASGNEVADVKALPPAVSAIYRFSPEASIRPYVGIGAHYTFFYDEDSSVPPLPGELELENEVGLVAIVGADFMIGQSRAWFINVDVRWFQKEPDLRIGAVEVGELDISPIAAGVMIGRQFSW